MDRLTSLNVFVAVAESGGFSAAARRLNMSTTMVSNHVRSLEEGLGARLMNRTTRKVSLTEVGRTYFSRASQILADLEEADAAAGALQSAPRGTLRLHTSASIVRFVAPVIAEFLALNPDVAVDHAVGENMVDLVEEGFDLAIRTTLPPDSSLIVRRLTSWRHILCCAPSYLEKRAAPEHPSDLVRHNCLRYTYYPYADGWHFTGPDGETIAVPVSGNLSSSSAEALRFFLLKGEGLLLAPRFLIGDELDTGKLVTLMPDYRPVEMAINAIYPHRRFVSAKVRGFIDLLAERISDRRQLMCPDWAPMPDLAQLGSA